MRNLNQSLLTLFPLPTTTGWAKRRSYLPTAFIGLLLFFAAQAPASADENVIDICFNLDEPEIYQTADDEFSGFWPSYLDKLVAGTELSYRFSQYTHERCQQELLVENARFDAILGRVHTPKRAQLYYTIPVYKQNTIIFYSLRAYPDGLTSPSNPDKPIDRIGEMKDLRVCGFHGWTYDYYKTVGFADDWEPILISEDGNGTRFTRALMLLKAGRCDAIEMPANTFTKDGDLSEAFKDIGCFPTRNDTPDILNMMLTKNTPYADKMAATLFQAATTLSQQREVEPLLQAEIIARLPKNLPDNIRDCMNQTVFGLHG